MSDGIIVCGLNGAGKSTLAKALAEKMNYRFIDIEDIYFPKSNGDYSYSKPLPFEEVQAALLRAVSENPDFVLACVKGDFSEEIVSHFTCAVYVDTPKDIRLKRVYERSFAKFGERMLKGGDLFEAERAFFDFVKSRDESTVENWLSEIDCPVIRVDGVLPICGNVDLIIEKLQK